MFELLYQLKKGKIKFVEKNNISVKFYFKDATTQQYLTEN
jgi:hypothetical protein